MASPKSDKVTIAGRFCESGDVLGKDVALQSVKKGDVIAAMCTGAYNYSMASNYNRVGRPAMVLVSGGIARLILKRESIEDIINNDVV
jgi:diaminopimelate decarboxylase